MKKANNPITAKEKKRLKAEAEIIKLVAIALQTIENMIIIDRGFTEVINSNPYLRAQINCMRNFDNVESFIYNMKCIDEISECDRLFNFKKFYNLKKIPFQMLYDLFQITEEESKVNNEKILYKYFKSKEYLFFEKVSCIIKASTKELSHQKTIRTLYNMGAICSDDYSKIIKHYAPKKQATEKFSAQKHEDYEKIKKHFQRLQKEKKHFKEEYEEFLKIKNVASGTKK